MTLRQGPPNDPSNATPPPSMPMTATARNTYLARMKRLAECVPGREIRAGARKLLHNRSAFTIKVLMQFHNYKKSLLIN